MRRTVKASLFLALVMAAPLHAQQRWTGTNTALVLGASAAIALDCSTTLDARNHPEWGETNPLLPAHPTTARIVATCASAVISTWALAALLPNPWRNYWLGTVVGVETWAGVSNLRIGARLVLP